MGEVRKERQGKWRKELNVLLCPDYGGELEGREDCVFTFDPSCSESPIVTSLTGLNPL